MSLVVLGAPNPTLPIGASQSLQAIMMDIGKRLDGSGASGFVVGTATSGSTTGQLEDTVKLKSGISQDDLHRDAWLWRPNATNPNDALTVIKDASSQDGLVFPDRTWANSPAGETYAIFHTVAPDSIIDCINRALQRMYFESEVMVTPSVDPDNAEMVNLALFRRYDVTTLYPWLTEPWQIRRVGYLAPNQSRADYWPTLIRGTSYRENNILYVWLPAGFEGNGMFYMRTVRPHYSWVNGGSSITGLVNAADTVDVDLNHVVAGTMVEIFDLLGQQLDDAAMKKYTVAQAKWANKFSYYTRQYFTLPRNEFYASQYLGLYGGSSGSADQDESGLAIRAM